jgi:hypothetical protein
MNEFLARFAPSNEIDPLAIELVDDALDPGTLGADTGPYGIDVGVARADRHLRTISSLARQHVDRDALVGDLRDLSLEEAEEEIGMGSAEDDVGPLTRPWHVQDDGSDRLAGAKRLSRDLLRSGQKRFDRAETDLGRSPVEMLDRSGDKVANVEARKILVV